MKRFTVSLIAALSLVTACSTYQQIATLSSENVKLKDDGSFMYKDAMLTIEYDFWAESGDFYFIVTNNTSEDIYLDLAESYFIDNGFAYDYYQNRTYVYKNDISLSSGSKSSTSKTGYAAVSAATTLVDALGGAYAVAGSLGASKGYENTKSSSVAIEKGISVEFPEKSVVCIPAHSSKSFEEFCVASNPYRECGFARNPSKKEKSIREYSENKSPKIIENRLIFKVGAVSVPVINRFYVSQYQNISAKNATEWIKMERCDGYQVKVNVHKLSGNNKFFISYGNPVEKDRK